MKASTQRLITKPKKSASQAANTPATASGKSVRAMAEEVLGSAEAANEWLTTKAMGLEFRRPIDLVNTSPGAEAVKTLLQRMKYGVYA